MKIIADGNIAHLSDFFNSDTLGKPVEIIAMTGREITAEVLAQHQPTVLLVRSVTPINEQLLANNTSVKFVGSATIGIDHVDVDYLAKRGIIFANASGCSKHSVAQYVVASIAELRPDYMFKSINLGIIGVGNIGNTLAQYAISYGWNVLGYDPLKPRSVVNNSSLETVLRESNVISFHVPLTCPKHSSFPTHHDYLMTKERWQQVSDTAIIVNTSRGAVLGRDDIVASPNVTVLDVFEHEPNIDAELLKACSIVTPHIAGYTLEGKLRGTQFVYNALCKFLQVTPTVDFHDYLPKEVPLFQEVHNPLKDHERHQLINKIPTMYDIRADDKRLRAVANAEGDIEGDDFDNLRKNYPLRREWQAYVFKV
ncbi:MULTISPECIES: 4-phosphoerythronate dehydrogenase [unclassified Moraxella]|uniref:4-phosphoerythronate dehydrogenase n=1 Tax=unclassified Moraxella TaxID=2685852 RepID=UPI003AF86C09